MAERKIGKVIYRKELSNHLELFRIAQEDGSPFPDYKSGQYIALSRENCKLTKKITDANGKVSYVYDLDESRNPRRGQVTHSYSISSAPYETKEHGYLEFYVVLDMIETDKPGRLSESLFDLDPESDNKITYMNKIAGEFTLDKRAAGFQNVVMIGTGTGLAPFASMVKQLHHEASHGKNTGVRYTLFHANRTIEELGYHSQLLSIEALRSFDFVYVPSVSRPSQHVQNDPALAKGRANNLLRLLFGMPLKEEEDFRQATESGGDVERARKGLETVMKPILPQQHSQELLLERMEAEKTVILTCGNPNIMNDIKYIAETKKIRFEKEEW